jgi:hypothetical protein
LQRGYRTGNSSDEVFFKNKLYFLFFVICWVLYPDIVPNLQESARILHDLSARGNRFFEIALNDVYRSLGWVPSLHEYPWRAVAC